MFDNITVSNPHFRGVYYTYSTNSIDEILRLCIEMHAQICHPSITALTKFDLDIIAYGREHVRKLQDAGRGGTAIGYISALNCLEKYIGQPTLSIFKITPRFIKDWMAWIRQQPGRWGKEKLGHAERQHPSAIRALHNFAKEEYNDNDANIIYIPQAPFESIKLPKRKATRKRALEAVQILQISQLQDVPEGGNFRKNGRLNFARDMFILSFCLIGMNAVDLYNCTEYKNGRITYCRRKEATRRSDQALISVKVEPEVQAIVDKYRDEDGKRVFRFYKMYSEHGFSLAINGVIARCKNGKNSYFGLKKVGDELGIEDLEFYAARHSWATIAHNDVGLDISTVGRALNHVGTKSERVTNTYIKRKWTELDRVNRQVLDFVFHQKLPPTPPTLFSV